MTLRLILVTVLTLTAVYALNRAYREGYGAAQRELLQQLEKENADAANEAEDWRGAYRACVADGGMFDFETGACDS